MKQLLQKEFRQGWRSFQIPGFLFILLFFAMLDPPAYKYMGQLFSQLVKDMVIITPHFQASDAFLKYLSDIAQIGILVKVIMTMGLVAKEKEEEIASWILTKPVTRFDYLRAKLIYMVAETPCLVFISSIAAYVNCVNLFGWFDAYRAFLATLGVIVYFLFILSITFLVSTVSKQSLLAGGAGVSMIFILWFARFFINGYAWSKYLPYNLILNITQIMNPNTSANIMIYPVLFTLLMVLIVFIIAFIKFETVEL